MVGDYVPFYFCPRSPMLYKISRGGEGLTYQDGQRDIVHLVTTVGKVVDAAGDGRWAFSDSNAGAAYARFADDLSLLEDEQFVDWDAVNAERWQGATMTRKMAEFLVLDQLPWSAIIGIGVQNRQVRQRTKTLLAAAGAGTPVAVRPRWYY